MAIYVPRFNLINYLKIRISNLNYTIANIKEKISFRFKKLSYDDIVMIEYESEETPEFIYESACIDKKILKSKDFSKIINVFKENKVLKWKKYYVINYECYDGYCWKLKITFKDGNFIEKEGINKFPYNWEKISNELENYMISTDDINLNEMIINKWFKKEHN